MLLMDMSGVDVLPGERILWQGRPSRHRLFWPPDVLLIPFSLLWCGFVVFWEWSALRSESGPTFFVLWGAVFVAIGLYIVAGRFVVRAIVSRRTRYVLTDRRVIVTGGLSGRRTESVYLADLPPPVISERDDRSGTLAFGALPRIADTYGRTITGRRAPWSTSRASAWRPMSEVPSSMPLLADIPEVRYVRDLLANAQAQARRPA